MAMNLYVGEPQHENFANMDKLYPTRKMPAASLPFDFPQGDVSKPPLSFAFDGANRSTVDFLKETDTGALLVLKDGKVRFEDYFLTGGRDVRGRLGRVCCSCGAANPAWHLLPVQLRGYPSIGDDVSCGNRAANC